MERNYAKWLKADAKHLSRTILGLIGIMVGFYLIFHLFIEVTNGSTIMQGNANDVQAIIFTILGPIIIFAFGFSMIYQPYTLYKDNELKHHTPTQDELDYLDEYDLREGPTQDDLEQASEYHEERIEQQSKEAEEFKLKQEVDRQEAIDKSKVNQVDYKSVEWHFNQVKNKTTRDLLLKRMSNPSGEALDLRQAVDGGFNWWSDEIVKAEGGMFWSHFSEQLDENKTPWGAYLTAKAKVKIK